MAAEREHVVLAGGLAPAIQSAARVAAPRECCGLLEGHRQGLAWQVTLWHPARNLADAADRFVIDPADHFAAQRAARARGAVIIGCCHSHPGGQPHPSATDLAAAGVEDFLWLIVAEGQLAAFVYRGGRFTALELRP